MQFSWQFSVFCNAIFFPQNIIATQTLQILILIQCLTMLKMALLCCKYPDYYYWRTLGTKYIKVSRKLDVFVKHRCLWSQQSPYEGKHSARHEYSLLLHFHNNYSVIISCCWIKLWQKVLTYFYVVNIQIIIIEGLWEENIKVLRKIDLFVEINILTLNTWK